MQDLSLRVADEVAIGGDTACSAVHHSLMAALEDADATAVLAAVGTVENKFHQVTAPLQRAIADVTLTLLTRTPDESQLQADERALRQLTEEREEAIQRVRRAVSALKNVFIYNITVVCRSTFPRLV